MASDANHKRILTPRLFVNERFLFYVDFQTQNFALRHRYCRTFIVFWGVFAMCIAAIAISQIVELFAGRGAHYDADLLVVRATNILPHLQRSAFRCTARHN